MNESIDVQKTRRPDSLQASNRPGRECSLDATDRGSSPTVQEGSADREIKLELTRVEHGEQIAGKLVRVELRKSSDKLASFTVSRSVDNLHLVAEARLGSKVHRGRVLPVRNRSSAQLLSREMEILCNDRIYEEAIAIATDLIDSSARCLV